MKMQTLKLLHTICIMLMVFTIRCSNKMLFACLNVMISRLVGGFFVTLLRPPSDNAKQGTHAPVVVVAFEMILKVVTEPSYVPRIFPGSRMIQGS